MALSCPCRFDQTHAGTIVSCYVHVTVAPIESLYITLVTGFLTPVPRIFLALLPILRCFSIILILIISVARELFFYSARASAKPVR